MDASELRALSRALKKAEPALAKDFTRALKDSAEIVAVKARANASFSSRIPKTIRASGTTVSAKVVAGGDAAPHAAPLEHGGKGGTFRHPVYGNLNVWVPQPAHPFLTPAGEESAPLVQERVEKAVDLFVALLG